MKKELRYYVPLVMGFIFMLIGIFTPPIGDIYPSILYGTGMFLIIAAAGIGLDIPATLHEINELKKIKINEINDREEGK